MNNKSEKRIIEQQEHRDIITPEQKEAKRLRQKYHEYLLSTSSDNTMRDKIDLSLIYPETMDKQELMLQVDDLKKCLDSFIPLLIRFAYCSYDGYKNNNRLSCRFNKWCQLPCHYPYLNDCFK